METFRNPPITEALIDIRVELPSGVELSHLEKLHDEIRLQYPTKKLRHRWEGKVEFKEGTSPVSETKDLGPDGILFWSTDEKQLVQFRLDGFTFNRLRPYKTWDSMITEAQPLWDIYVVGIKPIQVARLALRYINSIEIPEKMFELEEYLAEPPRIPNGLSPLMEEFLSRIVIAFPEFDAKAIITQAPQPSKNPNVTSILLDLDVSRSVNLEPRSQDIWVILSKLRDLKNRVFDKYITEKTKELFR
ncbi:MAG: hypothetical protein CV090_06295 [Nitrospira sp. WS238]|nr:hypothetical protein [Nitrospira sp. WS238]